MKKTLLLAKLYLSHAFAYVRRKMLGAHTIGILTQTENGLLAVPADDFAVARKLAFEGAYEQTMIDSLLAELSPQSRVLIVGGHIGSLVFPLAARVASVEVVEANPKNAEFLDYNIRLNQAENVTLHRFAASDASSNLSFLTNTHNSGGSKIKPAEAKSEFYYDNPEVIEVEAKPLDTALKNTQFDLIIMDIEGSEYKALRGMPKILAKSSMLLLEILPNHIDHVAGVSPDIFLKTFQEHFTAASVIDSSENRYNQAAFGELIDHIYDHDFHRGRDVLFKK